MSSSAPAFDTVAALASGLAIADEAGVERARRAADERPIEYVLGSGEAEEVALYAGLKPIIRQYLRRGEVEATRARLESRGFVVADAEATLVEPPYPGRYLYAGRDAARVRAAVHADTTTSLEESIGRLLGYPECCIAAFLESHPPRKNAALHKLALGRTRGACHPSLNVLDQAVFHFLPWLPCSFSCAPSIAFATAVARVVATSHGQWLGGAGSRATCPPGCRHQRFITAIGEALGAHRLVLFEAAQISFVGRREGERFVVGRAWPTSRDRPPSVASDPVAREATARVLAAIEAAGNVAVVDGVLWAGDEPLLATPELLIVPFGDRR